MQGQWLGAWVGLIGLGFASAAAADPASDGYGPVRYGCPASWIVGECSPKDYPGKAAIQQCLNQVAHRCVNRAFQVAAKPHFLIMSLMYAPPGCGSNGAAKYQCKTIPSVTYTASSTVGTKLTISNSTKAGVSLSASIPLIVDGVPIGAFGADGDWSTSSTDSQSISFAQSSALGETSPGLPIDGINHENDTFEVLVNPLVISSGEVRTGFGHHEISPAYWNVGYDGPSKIIVLLKVSELRHPEAIDSNTAALLKQYGWGAQDFRTILDQDPMAQGKPIDAARYTQEPNTLPYRPSLLSDCVGGTCTCSFFQYSLSQTHAIDTVHAEQTSYSVGMSLKLGEKAADDIFTAKDSLTWTNTVTNENSSSKTNAAALQLGCASPAYTGPTEVDIYWDTTYGTFMFAPHALAKTLKAKTELKGVKLAAP